MKVEETGGERQWSAARGLEETRRTRVEDKTLTRQTLELTRWTLQLMAVALSATVVPLRDPWRNAGVGKPELKFPEGFRRHRVAEIR
ncbi:hypothetical protein BaRGS_00008783, partial [Batillaria attramentaria]